jgi:nitroreductase
VDVLETIAARFSVRAYSTEPVDDQALHSVLDAARLAPTANNQQPFQVIVIHTKDRKADLARIYSPRWFSRPPLVLAVVSVPGGAWRRVDDMCYDVVDATIAMDHMILAATSLGLGTCWVADFDPVAAREALGLPDDVEPIAFTPLGHPARAATRKRRRPLEKLVRYERW